MAATEGAMGRIGAMPNASPRRQYPAAIPSDADAGVPTDRAPCARTRIERPHA
jgi:hypothetical protein